MLQNIPVEVYGSLIGLIGAFLGYAFREYKNRARPFFYIVQIDGTVIKNTDTVNVPKNIIDKLSDNSLIKELPQTSVLRSVEERRERAEKIKEHWPQIDNKIQEIIDSQTEDVFMERLREVFNLPFFEEMTLYLLVLDKIRVRRTNSEKAEKIPIYDDEEKEGSVWICFPEDSKQFGNHFKVPAIRAKCQSFLNAIRVLHQEALKETLNQVRAVMQKEYQSALSVTQSLSNLRNENSRWVFYSYFANLGHHPLIIERNAEVIIRDPKTGTFREICYLAFFKDGSIQDTDTPIVVKAGADMTICFITTKIQKAMELGNAIRESYERGQATCQLLVKLTKIGLLKSQQIRSLKIVFSKNAQQ